MPAEAQAGFTLVRWCPLFSEVPLVGGVNIGESAVNACGGCGDPVWKSVWFAPKGRTGACRELVLNCVN